MVCLIKESFTEQFFVFDFREKMCWPFWVNIFFSVFHLSVHTQKVLKPFIILYLFASFHFWVPQRRKRFEANRSWSLSEYTLKGFIIMKTRELCVETLYISHFSSYHDNEAIMNNKTLSILSTLFHFYNVNNLRE